MLLPLANAFAQDERNTHVPEVVPIHELTTRAIETAAAEIEPEEIEWPTATT